MKDSNSQGLSDNAKTVMETGIITTAIAAFFLACVAAFFFSNRNYQDGKSLCKHLFISGAATEQVKEMCKPFNVSEPTHED